jgi:hypothetical protein
MFETPERVEHRAALDAALQRISDRDPDLGLWLRDLNSRHDLMWFWGKWVGGAIVTITGTAHPAVQAPLHAFLTFLQKGSP